MASKNSQESQYLGLKQVFAVSIGLFLVFLDSTVVNIALPTIIDEYSIQLSTASWIINSFVLTLAVTLVTLGKLADLTGRVNMFLSGLILFMISSFLCGISPSAEYLILFRILQGIGGAMVIPTSMMLVRTAVPPEKMGLAMGIWGAVGALAVALGPSLGGVITEYINWRWVFYINVPIVIVTFPFIYLIIRQQKEQRKPFKLDLFGILTLSIGLFFLTYAILQGEEMGWLSTEIIVYFTISVLTGVAFFLIERKVQSPLLDRSLLQNRLYVGGLISNFLGGILLMGTLILLPLFLIRVKDFTTLDASLAITPLSAVMLIIAPLIGRLIDRIGYFIPTLFGYIACMVGFGFLSTIDAFVSMTTFIMILTILGMGLGVIMVTSVTVCTASVSNEQVSTSSGIFAMIRNTGAAVGVALFISITLSFLNQYSSDIVDEGIQLIKDQNFAPAVENGFITALEERQGDFFEGDTNTLSLDEESKQQLVEEMKSVSVSALPEGVEMTAEVERKVESEINEQLKNIEQNLEVVQNSLIQSGKEYVAQAMTKSFISGIILCFIFSLSLPMLMKTPPFKRNRNKQTI
ncbi:MFS transporter [Chengkuizengella axinellae]|uniref:MFS transporter n=1 Tax=Chengkuizengella axinellae TaxID=3064388 RepID=A0ABT9IU08_9BACL|nr:MFS transporter [Chengkuizengella sp. 2205SS18-9]MDP5272828.1 MFS transporter [Chengkuizengella sp. 2205SS18-9]